jgi:hypothetical protein
MLAEQGICIPPGGLRVIESNISLPCQLDGIGLCTLRNCNATLAPIET